MLKRREKVQFDDIIKIVCIRRKKRLERINLSQLKSVKKKKQKKQKKKKSVMTVSASYAYLHNSFI